MQSVETPPWVVVGIDGSEAAVGAALWGIDEAVARDIPLRLVYAIDPRESIHRDADSFAHRLATAEIAVRYAMMAVEASEQAVKIEIEIVHEQSVAALTRASRSAVLLCVGASRHSSVKRVGSTAAALSASAQCPVALLRGNDKVVRGDGGWIGVVSDRSGQNGVLVKRALEEAMLRHAQVRVLNPAQGVDVKKAGVAAAERDNDICDSVDPRLADRTGRDPELGLRSVPLCGSIADYLNEHSQSIKLFVVCADSLGQPDSAGESVLYDTDCPLLILRGDSHLDHDRAAIAEHQRL
ncbi:universal stress protein [Mycobacterium sp.]|uniref:universal stress protein n=1 Tax=Mycobacterium sp. TaxID=1785 RepID=UPI003BAE7B46